MEALTAMLTITAPIIVTVVLTNYQTQKIIQTTIETSNRQTQKIIQKTTCQTLKLLHEIKELQKKMHHDHSCLLRKIDVGLKANAAMHGWSRIDNISPKKARKLPEPKVYDSKLRICYFKTS